MVTKLNKYTILCASVMLSYTSFSMAEEAGNDVQDMSDPLAVYTQAGLGYTDKGLNLKFGQTYDTGSDTTMGMNILELKGFAGEAFGWSGDSRSQNDDSLDSIRYRNFSVDLTNGRGAQIDINYGLDADISGTKKGSASYSLIQALPKMGPVNLYPLAGVGVAIDNTRDAGFEVPGMFGVVGMYGKLELTDKIWINYNPMYLTAIDGSDAYKDNAFGVDTDSIFMHEAAVSYQINPRTNVRYFANWTENTHFADGDHRIEVNYQF